MKQILAALMLGTILVGLRHYARHRPREVVTEVGPETGDTGIDREVCRLRPEPAITG